MALFVRKVFTRFKYERNKLMYSSVDNEDLILKSESDFVDNNNVNSHIENVLNTYGNFSGPQLEALSHREEPWLKARGGIAPNLPCNNVISRESMKDYYSKLREVQ